MNKQFKRLATAALLSFGVYALTYTWYVSTETHFDNTSSLKPVAFISTVKEDVQRRPSARLIWQMLTMGEPVYTGEAIRTSNKGEVRIQFADTNRYIDLEPETLIVISQSNNEISLDLMDGSLFVAGGSDKPDEAGPALTLKSSEGKVDLTKATAQLSKSAEGKLDLQVIKGSAKIDSGTEVKEITKKMQLSQIFLESPELDQPYVVNPQDLESVALKWTGNPENTVITMLTGPTRKNLKEYTTTEDTTVKQIEKKWGPGKYYFKLQAKDENKKVVGESPIYRIEVVGRYAPSPIAPEGLYKIETDNETADISFKWRKPETAKDVVFEVAKNQDFSDRLETKTFATEENTNLTLPTGSYYWRLAANYDGLSKPVIGKPLSFSVHRKAKIKINLAWDDANLGATQYFVTKPKLKASWVSEQSTLIHKYKMVIQPGESFSREPASDKTTTLETNDMSIQTELNEAGRYSAIIEAYDSKGVLVASTEPRAFDVQPLPLLQAPTFEPTEGDFKTDQKGNLDIKWTKVSGAKEYTLVLLDKDGKEVKKSKYQSNATSFMNLLPGQYKVEVYATDEHGRDSEKVSARTLQVPESSGLKAPKLKKVKVN